jgi:hypothetical protein
MTVQTRMLVDEIASQNRSDHQAMRDEIARNGRDILAQVGRHTKKWAVGAALVGFVGVALPVYSQIRTAYADDHVRAVAEEKCRQTVLERQQSRETELQAVADLAARRAVNLVTLPADKIGR